jgi:hypothetical protein
MVYLTFVLLVAFFTAHTATDAHPVKQYVVDRIVNDPKINDENHSVALANYRHRVEHSPNLKAFRFAIKVKYNAPEYCEACDILVPVVSELSSCISAINLSYNRCV